LSTVPRHRTRSQRANAIRTKQPADEVAELRRRLKAERLEEYVRQVVDAAPELSDEQLVRIAELLRPGGAA
jgi:hypothetical protein